MLEVSSQALAHHRVDGVPFEAVAFTNLSEDHIGPGEHPDFEDYKNAKRRLFACYDARVMVYNADDPASAYMRAPFRGQQVSFGVRSPADYRAGGLAPFRSATALGVDFVCEHGGERTPRTGAVAGGVQRLRRAVRHRPVRGVRRHARSGRPGPGPHHGAGPVRGGGGPAGAHLPGGLLPQRPGPDQRPSKRCGPTIPNA